MLSTALLSSNTNDTSFSLREFENTNDESFLYTMLEFNDSMHEIDTSYKINYYRALLAESTMIEEYKTYSENFISTNIELIIKQIFKIIRFVGQALKFIINKFKKVGTKFLEFVNQAKEEINQANHKFIVYNTPSTKEFENAMKVASNIMNKLNDDLKTISTGSVDTVSIMTDDEFALELKKMYSYLSTQEPEISDIETSDKAKQFITNHVITSTVKSMTDKDYMKYIENFWNDNIIVLDDSIKNYKNNITSTLEKIADTCKKFSGDDVDVVNVAKVIINNASKLAINVVSIYDVIQIIYVKTLGEFTTIVNMIKNGTYMGPDSIYNEAGSIHGEIFDAETLFGNEDLRDFGRNEWDDLSDIITTESFTLKYAEREYRKRVTLKECLILSEEGLLDNEREEKIQVMKEAEKAGFIQTIKNIVAKIISVVKDIWAKIRNTFNRDVIYIKQNKNRLIDVGKNIAEKSEYLTNIDIEEIINVRYDNIDKVFDAGKKVIKSLKDASNLESIEEFSKNIIEASINEYSRNDFSKLPFKNDSNYDITSYKNFMEWFFGYYDPEIYGENCISIEERQIHSNIREYIDFLINYKNIERSINRYIDRIKNLEKEIISNVSDTDKLMPYINFTLNMANIDGSSLMKVTKKAHEELMQIMKKRLEVRHIKCTDEFYEAVDTGNVLRTRIMMKDSLLVDKSFDQYDEMEKAASSMKGLYDVHDGEELIEDREQWDVDYMNMLMVEVVNNFSHERLEHLKAVVRYLYPNQK